MASARLIVCETTSKWAVALRRQLPPELIPHLLETRLLDDYWQHARARPASLVVLEVTGANLEHLVALLPRHRAQLPRSPVVVVGSRELEAVAWMMRELGAVHVIFSRREMDSVVRIVRRHWRGLADGDTAAGLPPWRRLPWEDATRPSAGPIPGNVPAWLESAR